MSASVTQTTEPQVRLVKAEREPRERMWIPSRNRWQRGFYNMTWRRYLGKPRLYISVEGESILENFAFRTSRPTKLYRAMLPAIFEALGLPPETKATWNRNAGCAMCPCSPGFVLDVPGLEFDGSGSKLLDGPRSKPWDAWATLTADDAVALKVAEVTDEVAYRAERAREILVEGRL